MRVERVLVVGLCLGLWACGGDAGEIAHGASCVDGIENADETGVDCGGPLCGPCGFGGGCVAPADCASGVCESGVCGCPVGFVPDGAGGCEDVEACPEGYVSDGAGGCEDVDECALGEDECAGNASPDSMAAALKTLAQVTGPDQRSVAVLGEMAELGEHADEEHDRIGRLVVRLNVRKLVVVGHAARHIHNAAGLEGSWDGESVLVGTADEAYDLLRDELREGDVVLVKSSGSAGLRFLGDRIAGVTE